MGQEGDEALDLVQHGVGVGQGALVLQPGGPPGPCTRPAGKRVGASVPGSLCPLILGPAGTGSRAHPARLGARPSGGRPTAARRTWSPCQPCPCPGHRPPRWPRQTGPRGRSPAEVGGAGPSWRLAPWTPPQPQAQKRHRRQRPGGKDSARIHRAPTAFWVHRGLTTAPFHRWGD